VKTEGSAYMQGSRHKIPFAPCWNIQWQPYH